MRDRDHELGAWQYHLVWTPGPVKSMVQLWAVHAAGHRQLWDHWEVQGRVAIPRMAEVLDELYGAVVELHERSTHIG